MNYTNLTAATIETLNNIARQTAKLDEFLAEGSIDRGQWERVNAELQAEMDHAIAWNGRS